MFALQFNEFRYSYVYMINTHLRKDEKNPIIDFQEELSNFDYFIHKAWPCNIWMDIY